MNSKFLYHTNKIRRFEQEAQDKLNIPSAILMQRAGEAAWRIFIQCFGEFPKNLLVFGGTGNNAGDGYVLAIQAHRAGWRVSIRYLGSLDQLKRPAKNKAEDCLAEGIECAPFKESEIYSAEAIIVDAVLGIGGTGPLREGVKAVIETINKLNFPVFSIDIPSGLNADTGEVVSEAVHAHVTVTFIALKQGLFLAEGPDHCGEIFLEALGLEALTRVSEPDIETIDINALLALLPPRKRNVHKGKFGHVLVIGGEEGMPGAVIMAALGAYRAGAGKVSIITHAAHAAWVPFYAPEALAYSSKRMTLLRSLLKQATVVVLGPGLGRGRFGKKLFHEVMRSAAFKVIDADALYFLTTFPQKKADWILTPHPGEAGTLLDKSAREIQADRVAAVEAIQAAYGGICILKGAGALISEGGLPLRLCTEGNPGMASAGMGDILSGVIAGLLAEGAEPLLAAQLGVALHAHAGDKAAKFWGERGLMATDLLEYLGVGYTA